VTARPLTCLAQVHSSLLFLQKQVAKLASRLLYSWSLLRNNNTAVNLQKFTPSYGSRRFAACYQGSHWGFFSTQICFLSRPVCLGYYEQSRDICAFWSDELISNFIVFNNIKMTLHYSAYMRTPGEKVRISVEAERVQSVSYSHIRSLSELYTLVCLREGKRSTWLGPPFATVKCKVAYLAFKWGPTATAMYKWTTLLSKGPPTAAVMWKYLAFKKGAQNNCNALFIQRAPYLHWFLVLHIPIWGSKLSLGWKVVIGLAFWTPSHSVGPPNWQVWSAADTALFNPTVFRQKIVLNLFGRNIELFPACLPVTAVYPSWITVLRKEWRFWVHNV